jgi:hypothetical protein
MGHRDVVLEQRDEVTLGAFDGLGPEPEHVGAD